MLTLIITIAALILVSITGFLMLKFGNETVYPVNKKIEFKISDKLLTIYSDEFSGKYNFYLPADIDIKSTDNVSISYNYDRGYLTGIRELYVNNILVIPEDKIKNISLTKILN